MKNKVPFALLKSKDIPREALICKFVYHTSCPTMSSVSLQITDEALTSKGSFDIQSNDSVVATSPISTKLETDNILIAPLTSATLMYSSNVGK